MSDFKLKPITVENIESELRKIGFDSSYIKPASGKFRYKTLKIYNLTPAQANILKQTALTAGTDCATNRDVITGKAEYSDVILTGSLSQLKKIAEKLKYQPFSLNILGEKILSEAEIKSSKTKLAGILNITPDSFSDGGLYFNPQDAIRRLGEMMEEGADIADIGAESTRPYSEPVSSEEQISRLKPVLEFAQKENISIPLSVDTRSSEVAKFALDCGVKYINDVSGFDYDEKLADVISNYHAGIIIQHSKGTPENMQDNPLYNDVKEDVYFSLLKKKEFALQKGIKDVILDIGIGFGKTREDNFTLINGIEEFFSLGAPLMVGISRKSFLCKDCEDNFFKDSLSASVSYPLILKGVDYLRVHNVKLHRKLLDSVI